MVETYLELQPGEKVGLASAQIEELTFWNTELRLVGAYSDVVRIRLNPQTRRAEYPHEVFLRIERQSGGSLPLKVLEIGPGPISTLAYGVDIGQIEVTAIDVLASQYASLMRELGLEYPITPIPGSAESLTELFEPQNFDCAFARNSLDHTNNLPLAFDNLVAMVRPKGFVFLMHGLREGENNKWSPSHNWNLDYSARTGLKAVSRSGNEYELESGKNIEMKYLLYAASGYGRNLEVLYQIR